jgi:flavin-binding protein dodecin
MPDHIYKTTELVGSSATGVEDAIRNAIAKLPRLSGTCAGSRWSRREATSRAVKWLTGR